MIREAKILLRDLHLQRDIGFLQRAKQWRERLSGLKVDGAVFNLHNDVVAELAVQRFKLIVGLAKPITLLGGVHKRTPKHQTVIGGDGIGQHIGAIGVMAVVILRTGLALGVGFNQKAAKIGNVLINFFNPLAPPLLYFWVQRVGAVKA